MKPTSLAERLKEFSQKSIVEDQKSTSFQHLANQINTVSSNQVAVNTYTSSRNEDIRNALKVDDNDKIVNNFSQ